MALHGMKLAILCITTMLLLSGCVSSEVRKGADVIAVFTHQVSNEGKEFVEGRTELAQSRRTNIAMLEENAVELESSVNRDLGVWALSGPSGKRRVELLNGLRQFAVNAGTRSAELDDLRKQHNEAIANAKSAANFRQADLAKVQKFLATLAHPPDLKSELIFLTNYFEKVQAGIDEAKKTADKRTKAAGSTTTNAVPPNEGNPNSPNENKPNNH